MTNEGLQKAKDLEKSLKTLDSLSYIMSFPYPSMFKKKTKDMFFGFRYEEGLRHETEICFAEFDEQTNKELKEAIKRVIVKRRDEIREEIAAI